MTVAPVVARTIRRFYSSHPYSTVGAAQHLSSFLAFSTTSPLPSFSIIISKPTHFISSLYSPTSPISNPFSTVSYHAVVARKIISSYLSTPRFPMIRHQSSAFLNSFTSSYSTNHDWSPPLRLSSIDEAVLSDYEEPDLSETHWLVHMSTVGMEFQTEQALFNYYIKTLAAVVGSDEEAKKKMYLVSCGFPFGFGAEVDEQTSYMLYGQPGVAIVMEDFGHKYRKSNLGDRSAPCFTPINWNHRFDDIFSYHHLSECNSAWKSDHWLVHIQSPHGEFSTKQQVSDICIRTLAEVVGSVDEAKKKIYLLWCKRPFGFGAEIDEEALIRLKALPDVVLVLPDYAFDVKLEDIAIVNVPTSHLKSCSSYYYYQPYQVHSHEDSEESMEEPLGESVQSLAHFTLMSHNHRLDNVFSYHHLSKKNSNWNSDHWLIVVKQPKCGFITKAQTLNFFIKILAEVVGSEQEAKEKIYIIWSNFPFGFGAEIDDETSNKLKGCPNVLKVLPDYAFDVKDKVTGGLLVCHFLQKSRFFVSTSNNLEKLENEDTQTVSGMW